MRIISAVAFTADHSARWLTQQMVRKSNWHISPELVTHIIYAIQTNTTQTSDCKRPSLTFAAAAAAPDIDELGAAAGGALCDTSLMIAELLWLLSAGLSDALVRSTLGVMPATLALIVIADPLIASVVVSSELTKTYTPLNACREIVYISDPTCIAVRECWGPSIVTVEAVDPVPKISIIGETELSADDKEVIVGASEVSDAVNVPTIAYDCPCNTTSL